MFTRDGDGYDISDEKSFGHISWEVVSKIVETKHAFHILFGKASFVVLPKRCFVNQTDLQTLREIFQTSLGQKVKFMK